MQTVEASSNFHSQTSFCKELISIKSGVVLGENENKKIADHLPTNLSLTVFKCVSKSWNKLISHVYLPGLSSNVCSLYCCERSNKATGWNFAAIVFDPIQSSDYKIVRPNPYLDIPSLDIFLSEIGEWARHEVPGDWVEHLYISEFDSPMLRGIKWAKGNVYLDGMLYTLTRGKYLVRFDLKSVAFSAEVMKVPCGANGIGLIGHSRGVLYYVNYDKESRLSMWQLDYDNTSARIWILKHSICTSDMLDFVQLL
ncbi:hypothetical protein MKX03_008390, partial [Papaver bracteatum]